MKDIPKELYEITKLQISSYYKYKEISNRLFQKAQISMQVIDKGEAKAKSNNEQHRLYEYMYVSEAISGYYEHIQKVVESYEDKELIQKIIKYILGERNLSLNKRDIKEFNKNVYLFIKKVIESSKGGRELLEIYNKYFIEDS